MPQQGLYGCATVPGLGLCYSSPAKGVKGTWGGKSFPSLESLTSVNLGSIT